MRLPLLLFLLVSLQSAWAQEGVSSPPPPPPESPPPLVQAPGEPEPPSPPPPEFAFTPLRTISIARGERVRVETATGESQTGELVSLQPGALSLQASSEQVVNLMLMDVQKLETRKRAPGFGALVGGGTGGALGGVLLALLCVAVAEGDDSGVGGCAVIGALLGGAFGAGVGALVGLALPRWSTIYDKKEEGELSLRLEDPKVGAVAHWLSGKGPVGEVGIQLGYGRDLGVSRPTEGWGGRLHLVAQLGPYFAVGPELAWYSHIGTETIASAGGGSFTHTRTLFQLGALARGGVAIGPTRTSLLLGLGLHSNRTAHIGASVGGEVELDLGEGLPPVAVDVRYHLPVDHDEFEPVEKFLTFGVGSRLRW